MQLFFGIEVLLQGPLDAFKKSKYMEGRKMSEKEKTEIIPVGPIDPNKRNSPINEGPVPEGGGLKAAYCWYGGVRHSAGAVIQQADGKNYICSGGEWWLK